ncbi:sigma-70 family RNA polymerase sigma factor [bacterium 0.1xD8-71]|jgi:RNA polymerase sigma factor (sigma-70 family)|nr:sigma-70 family RNA polymerase sigma factor [Lachnospiraceae bacterium]NDO51937.1 sigma-70 family RNA polymerase sigma factor [Lachnospiraceae bacterium MD335]RKI77023.1 sigma-70 family RNA polymerase sigma factor [bacterium 0.1xD8-71]
MSVRKITVKSGNEESTLDVTEEEYQNYYRPWWQQKKREQRNREAMEQNGYTEESYEAWRDNASEEVGIPDMEPPGMDELVEKKLLLGVLADAMESLLPEERELAMKVFGEEMPLADYAEMKGKNPRTLSDHKRRILSKLRKFFTEHGFEVDNK